MKSFFKKLAFVMALTMVVTMAAPAGIAAQAANFFIATQEDNATVKTEITEFKLAVDAKQDFKYIGATDHTKYNFTWKSSKPDVASVDKSGLVTGLKDGATVITVTGTSKADGKTVGYTASMVVTVGEGDSTTVVGSGYTVKQDTASTIKIFFDAASTHEKEDFELFYVMDGGWSVSWPIKSVDPVKDAAGNVIKGQYTLTPYVEFVDGDKYILKVDGEKEGTEFVTSFGKLTHLEIHYTCNGVTDQGAVVNTVNEDDVYPVQCFVKFFAGEVDVTELYEEEQEEVEYQMVSSDAEYIDFDDNGELEFEKVGVAAVITATYEYEDPETGDETPVNSLKAVPIVSVPLPEYNLTLVDWAIVNTTTQVGYDKIDWSVKTMRANDEALYGRHIIVAKFTDSFGKTFISDPAYLPDVTQKQYEGWYSTTTEGTSFDKGEFYLNFKSADNDKLLVGLDTEDEASQAYLTTHTDANVAIIVGLYSYDEDLMRKSTGFVKNVAAFTLKVTEERHIKTIKLSEDDIDVPHRILDDADEKFLEKTVKLYLLDQYGEAWKQEETIKVIADEKTGATTKVDVPVVYDPSKGYAEVTVVGDAIWTAVKAKNKSSAVITLEITENYVKHDVELEVTAVNTTDNKNGEGPLDVDKTPALAVNNLDVAYFKENYDTLPRETEIALHYVANKMAVGYAEDVNLYNNVLNAKGEEVNFPAGTTVGSYFLAVYGPDNKLVDLADTDEDGTPDKPGVYQKNDGTFSIVGGLANSASIMKYLDTGKYKLELRVVEWNKSKECMVTDEEEEVTFTISNSSKKLEFVNLNDVETEEDELTAIIDELVKVTVGGVEWDFNKNDIAKVEGRYNEDANQIIIKKVWFNVPLDAYSYNIEKAEAYSASVTINRAIELGEDGYDEDCLFDASGFWYNN